MTQTLFSLSPYLASKRQELVDTLAKLKDDRKISGQAKKLIPVVESRIKEVSDTYHSICEEKLAQLIQAAENEAIPEAKQLEPLDNVSKAWRDGKQGAWATIIASGFLGFLISVGLTWFVGWLGLIALPLIGIFPLVLYKKYKSRAEGIYVRRKIEAPSRLQKAIANYEIVLVQFAPSKTYNYTYNYNCTQVAIGQEKDVMQIWKLEPEKYGNLYGCTFIGIREVKGEGQIAALFKLNTSGLPLDCIELRPGFLHNLRHVKKAFLEYLSKESNHLIDSITPLTDAIAQYDVKTKQEQEFTNQLADLDAQIEQISKIGVEPATLDNMLLQIDMFRTGGATSPRGMLLYGPTGTGKTKIGLNIATATRCGYLKVDVAELKMGGPGTVADKVKKLWRRASLLAPCMLFLDDCDNVFDPNINMLDKKSTERELVDSFLSEWDTFQTTPGRIMVLGATNRRESLDMAVLMRFDQLVEIGLPGEQVRERILAQEFITAGVLTTVSSTMVKETAGMAGRELQQLAMRVKGLLQGKPMNDVTFKEALKNIRSKASTLTEQVSWREVILPEEMKSKLQYLAKKIKQTEEYAKMGLPVSKSLLLYGPPGTGKTQIARALATESNLSFMAVTTADIKGNKTGDSGKFVQALFERARSQSPCLLFIDEIDIVTMARTNTDLIGQEIVGQFLQEMDGINSRTNAGQVFVIGATNNKDIMDPAVLSRFSDQEEIALPTLEARTSIIGLNLNRKPVAFDIPVVAARVAQATDGLSGRDLFSLVNAAASRAMQRADALHLDIKTIKLEEKDFDGLTIGDRVIRLSNTE